MNIYVIKPDDSDQSRSIKETQDRDAISKNIIEIFGRDIRAKTHDSIVEVANCIIPKKQKNKGYFATIEFDSSKIEIWFAKAHNFGNPKYSYFITSIYVGSISAQSIKGLIEKEIDTFWILMKEEVKNFSPQ